MNCAHDWAWYGWTKPMRPPIYIYRCESCGEEGWSSVAPPAVAPIEPQGILYDAEPIRWEYCRAAGRPQRQGEQS